MAAFKELNWDHIDVWAIVSFGGVVTIKEQEYETYHSWLVSNGYTLDTIDCARPVNEILAEFYRLFDWEKKFEYTPDPTSRELDAFRDGFSFEIPEGGGHVLELVRVDVAWQQEPDWVRWLLFITREHSRWHLALGRRFFGLLVVPEHSEMLGAMIEEIKVPHPLFE